MICRLCLRKDFTEAEAINIFDAKGIQMNVSAILEKHFWFEPKSNDPVSTAICNMCWLKVADFHTFYISVEDAHRIFSERFSIKTEANNEQRQKAQNEIETEALSSPLNNISKHEPHEEKIDEINLEFNIPHVEICETDKNENEFYDEIVMEDVLANNEGDESSIDCKDALDVLIKEEATEECSEQRLTRSTRSSIKSIPRKLKKSEITSKRKTKMQVKKSPMCKRRERLSTKSKTDDNINISAPELKNKKEKSKNQSDTDANTSANSDYKEKMREVDEKISQNMRLVCDICAAELPTFGKLRHHMRESHNVLKGYAVCCNKKFYIRVLLVDHINRHLNPEHFKCNECNKVFTDNRCLRNHVLSKHQPDEVKTFECQHCPEKFTKFYLLQQHRVKHEEKTHICNECNKGFAAGYQLTAHIKMTHANEGIMCDLCAKVLHGRTVFNLHQLEHSGVPQPKVQCEKCGSWHKNKLALMRHRKRHNDEGILHECSFCGKVSPNRGSLMAHVRAVHKDGPTFECSACTKTFKKAISLKEHMASHTGEVLYKCPHCTRTFNSNANMHSHRKKMHPKEFEETRRQRRENASIP